MAPKEKQKIEIEKSHRDPLLSFNQAVTVDCSDFLGTALKVTLLATSSNIGSFIALLGEFAQTPLRASNLTSPQCWPRIPPSLPESSSTPAHRGSFPAGS